MLTFQMSDARFNCSSSFHPTPETFCCPTSSGFIHMYLDVAFVATTKPFPVKAKRWGKKILFDILDLDAHIDGMSTE